MPDYSFMAVGAFAQLFRMFGGCIYWILPGWSKRALKAELDIRGYDLIHGLIIAVSIMVMTILFFIRAFLNL